MELGTPTNQVVQDYARVKDPLMNIKLRWCIFNIIDLCVKSYSSRTTGQHTCYSFSRAVLSDGTSNNGEVPTRVTFPSPIF